MRTGPRDSIAEEGESRVSARRPGARRFVVVAFACMLAAEAATAATCAQPKEHTALDARVLQSELMLGALACDERQRWGRFVERFGGVLSENGNHLRSYFRRAHGPGARRALDDFTTELANEASQRRLQWSGDYCGFITALFDHTLALDNGGFESFVTVQPFAQSHGVRRCR